MKRKLWLWFTLSPVIVIILWLLTSVIFRILNIARNSTAGMDIAKNFINRWLWILALLSIPLLIIGIVFLSTPIVKEIIKNSRTSAKKNMNKFMLWFGIYIVLQTISSFFWYSTETGNINMTNIVITIIIYIATFWLSLWFKNLSLNIVNDVKIKVSDIFVSFKKFIKYLWAYLLVFIIVGVWIILFVVPWIIFGLKLSMVPYLILDKNMWPLAAIKKSWKMTKWFLSDLLGLNILCGLINILWLLALFVWLLRTLPLFMIANAYIYKKILATHKK